MRRLVICSLAAVLALSSALAAKAPAVVLPETVVGTFNGLVGRMVDGEFVGCGTLLLTVAETGKLTAKVVTAAGTSSLSAKGWDSAVDGIYAVRLSKKGASLDLALDANAAWDVHQLGGTFVAGEKSYVVMAQRKAFVMTWYFTATGDAANGWTLGYAPDAKSAALTLKVKADGSTSLAGKLDGIRVSASGAEDVSGFGEGAILADFLPTVSVKSGKKTVKRLLYVRTNLWFDRSPDHVEGVGTASFVE